MKVLLIQVELNPGTIKDAFHHGLSSLASYLMASGHEVAFRRLSDPADAEKIILDDVKSINPGLIGFTSTSDEWIYVKQAASWIKENYNVPIICGGPHPTVAPEESISDENIDIICRGEGEEPLAELCLRMENGDKISDIQNLWVKEGDEIIKNTLRPLVQDIDSFPLPAFELMGYQKTINIASGATLMLGKGCPFRCSYCINAGLQDIYKGLGKYVRKRSPEKAIEMIKFVVNNFKNVTSLSFEDEVFVLDREWLDRFSVLYKKEIGLPFGCYMRIEYITRENLERLYTAGCRCFSIGVESGSRWLRENVLNRKMTNEVIIEKFKLIDEFGIQTIALNMMGLPYETPVFARETLMLNSAIRPSSTICTLFQPYPGTKLHEVCRENNWIKENLNFTDKNMSILNLPEFTREECSFYTDRLNHLGYSISAKKHPVGIYDFLANIDQAEIHSVFEGHVEVSKFERLGDFVLKAIPPARITYCLFIPEKSYLNFEIGIHDAIKSYDGVLFAVEIFSGTDFKNREFLYSRYLSFSQNINTSGWHKCSIDLSKYANENVKISFITKEGPRTACYVRAAGWQRPHIQEKTIECNVTKYD